MGSRNANKNSVIRYFTDKELQEFTLYHKLQHTCHCAKCECFNVNKMLCLKGVYFSFLPEQDPHPGHNWNLTRATTGPSPRPQLDPQPNHNWTLSQTTTGPSAKLQLDPQPGHNWTLSQAKAGLFPWPKQDSVV